MQAIRINQFGDANVLQLQEIATPKPNPDEALIRIKFAGVNFRDIYLRNGRQPIDLPCTPGLEASGIVEAIGENVKEVQPGDRVAYSSTIGSYAEFNIVKAWQLIPLPDDISFEQGATFPLQGMTAHYLLHEFYQIKPGDQVLVHAAAGGLGLLLVQWLKHKGAVVIGTVSTPEKARIAKEAGADHIIFYNTEDFVTATKKLTQNKGVDYILDGVGKTTFTKDLEAVRIRGCICLYGSASGPADPFPPNSLQAKALTLAGGTLINFITTREEMLTRAAAVIDGMRAGWLKLKIGQIFPLAQAAEAQRLLESRKTIGKIILEVAK
ncbi:MAG TPA: quinone oxidoreductase [Gammaproteobacteria bacterium]|nr:quinone oxidoreductase [Gammaproteobacteria bacterium]